ncbi:hypothetical protein [Tropicibacter oceani]|uniref:Uncharacterized protein n=1 Tax=Tropicibacter oceani TaxID=3058420 RepID=A0ABY8QJH9_9RHOB|nr:hypothetical protein [Tropicibacter oceani]WGW04774.1 hypothetical protein QF118_04275 [Tropicibacter oceani]
MSNFSGAQREHLTPRAQAISTLFERHFRAEIAEALLSEKPAPRVEIPKAWLQARDQKAPPPSPAQLVLRYWGELSRNDAKKLAKRLMSEDLRTGLLLPQKDRDDLEKLVQPNAKTPMADRSQVSDQLTETLELRKIRKGDEGSFWGWLKELLKDLYPGHDGVFRDIKPTVDNDGRPEDQDTPPGPEDEPTTPPPPTSGTPGPQQIGYQTLRLNIDRVRCLRRTRGEAGDDEMAMGGVAVHGPLAYNSNPSLANGEQFGPTDLGSFSQGQREVFNPPLLAHEYDLGGLNLPHVFLPLFTLAELDPAGGFMDFLTELMTSIEAEISSYELFNLIYAYYNAISVAVLVPLTISFILTGPIGVAIVGIVGIVVGVAAIFLALGTGNRDDIFDVREIFLALTQQTLAGPPFNGTSRTDTEEMIIHGDGGRYQVDFHWQLAGQIPVLGISDQDPPVWTQP